MSGDLHISSLVVQTRPDALSAVREAIEQLGAEVPMDDPAGKLVVVIETASEAGVNSLLDHIGALEGVLSANLVYHLVEDEPPAGPGEPSAHAKGETR